MLTPFKDKQQLSLKTVFMESIITEKRGFVLIAPFKRQFIFNYMNKRFAVQSNSFSLYEAFKKEVEKLGFTYKDTFTPFIEDEITYHDCLFFCDGWDSVDDKLRFSLSNAGRDVLTFSLESEWEPALTYAKEYAAFFNQPNQKKKKIRISISKIAAKHGVSAEDVIVTA